MAAAGGVGLLCVYVCVSVCVWQRRFCPHGTFVDVLRCPGAAVQDVDELQVQNDDDSAGVSVAHSRDQLRELHVGYARRGLGAVAGGVGLAGDAPRRNLLGPLAISVAVVIELDSTILYEPAFLLLDQLRRARRVDQGARRAQECPTRSPAPLLAPREPRLAILCSTHPRYPPIG